METIFHDFSEGQAYALGLLWADGSMTKNNSHVLSIETVEEDFNCFLPALQSLGKLSTNKRQRPNRKPQASAYINNKELRNVLFKLGFCEKSKLSPCKIIELLPKKHIKDFVRGWVDGDGCFYVNLKNKQYQFSISGSYEQDWTALKNILDSLGIIYKYWQQKQFQHGKENSYSYLRVIHRPSLIKLIDFIYEDASFMLYRKFEKCKLIKSASYRYEKLESNS